MGRPVRRNGMTWAQMYRQMVPGSKWARRKGKWPPERTGDKASRRREREEAIRDAS